MSSFRVFLYCPEGEDTAQTVRKKHTGNSRVCLNCKIQRIQLVLALSLAKARAQNRKQEEIQSPRAVCVLRNISLEHAVYRNCTGAPGVEAEA